MKQERITEGLPWSDPRGQVMKTPDDVAEMLRLRACGWGLKRIARQLGCSHHTVKDYVAAGGLKPFKSPERPSRSVQFNDKLIAFAKHWGFRPRACAPYRARTKGKTENGVGYVKKNAIAGHSFPSWEAFEAHLDRWEREVANVRIHGTTGERCWKRRAISPSGEPREDERK